MQRLKILEAKSAEIAARMQQLGHTRVGRYLTDLIRADLKIQLLRERYGIIPFSRHRFTWCEWLKIGWVKLVGIFTDWRVERSEDGWIEDI